MALFSEVQTIETGSLQYKLRKGTWLLAALPYFVTLPGYGGDGGFTVLARIRGGLEGRMYRGFS